MKKNYILLIFSFFVITHLVSQEVITNSTILKMTKAKLSDEIIIDEINNSPVHFDISNDSIQYLKNQNVSAGVIEAMKEKANPVSNVAEKDPVVLPPEEKKEVKKTEILPPKQIDIPTINETAPEPITDNYFVDRSTLNVNSISYVNNLNDIAAFYDGQFTAIMKLIEKYDKSIRTSLEKEKLLTEQMRSLQKELILKKNSNAKRFNNEISVMKATLGKYRTEHELLKSSIKTYGIKMSEELMNYQKTSENAIDDTFNEIIKKINKSDPDPSISSTSMVLTIPTAKFQGNLIPHTEPLSTIPAFYQNEILIICDTIRIYTKKALSLIKRDSVFKSQLEPLTKELTQYLATSKDNQKLNKLDIEALKKQCAGLTKERKNLAKQMDNESEMLSGSLEKLKKDILMAIEERFTDAIENIGYSYSDRF